MLASLPFAALLQPILALAGLGLGIGALLGGAARLCQGQEDKLASRINALLPQTQCGQCGHPGCKPYSEAIARGEAINKCPPGGERTIAALAELLNLPPTPLDAAHGQEEEPRLAVIREDDCVGCAKCIPACPVDAILGSPQRVHTVIAAECTGCGLCLPPCPVDCIDLLPLPLDANSAELGAGEHACIRCGLCAEVCPAELLPQQLYQASRRGEHAEALDLRLMECIECHACATVCPSGIPLVAHYQASKMEIRAQGERERRADKAKLRFERRQARLSRLQAEEEQRRRKRARLAEQDRARIIAGTIEPALARVKAKWASPQ